VLHFATRAPTQPSANTTLGTESHAQNSFPSTAVCGGRHCVGIFLDDLFPIPDPAHRPASFLRTRYTILFLGQYLTFDLKS
jgi:hypothetical protein